VQDLVGMFFGIVEELQKVLGIGSYIARAIASIH